MAKIINDKYYTDINVANYCIDKVYEIIDKNDITDVIEPSIGNGAFTHHNEMKINVGYDIEPELTSETTQILQEDFLEADIQYKKGRLVIGNPPYGRCLYLAQQFFKKAVSVGDYIAFILPISQLNNKMSMYEFDLVYSEDLGIKNYTDRSLHCCLNIYKRPINGLNSRPKAKLRDLTIIRQDKPNYEEIPFDIRMCYWGNGSAGKILQDGEHYSGEYKIQIHNKDLYDDIINVLKTFNWEEYRKCIAMRRITQYHIINILKDKIPNIQ